MRTTIVVLLLCLIGSVGMAQDRIVRDLQLKRKFQVDSIAAPTTTPTAGVVYLWYEGLSAGWKWMGSDGVTHSMGEGSSGLTYPGDSLYVLRGNETWGKVALATLVSGGMAVARGDSTIRTVSFVLGFGGLDSSLIALNDTTTFGFLPWNATIDSIAYLTNGACNITPKILYGTFGAGLTATKTSPAALTAKGWTSISSLDNSTPSSPGYFGILFSSITTKPGRLTWYIIGKLRF
jgi:hypothetical protein